MNRTELLEYSYTQYVDIFTLDIIGNQDFGTAASTTLTDFTTMYFFRNSLFGSTGNNIVIDPSFTFFYYNASSQNGSITPSLGLNERSRVCPSGNDFYFYEN